MWFKIDSILLIDLFNNDSLDIVLKKGLLKLSLIENYDDNTRSNIQIIIDDKNELLPYILYEIEKIKENKNK